MLISARIPSIWPEKGEALHYRFVRNTERCHINPRGPFPHSAPSPQTGHGLRVDVAKTHHGSFKGRPSGFLTSRTTGLWKFHPRWCLFFEGKIRWARHWECKQPFFVFLVKWTLSSRSFCPESENDVCPQTLLFKSAKCHWLSFTFNRNVGSLIHFIMYSSISGYNLKMQRWQ